MKFQAVKGTRDFYPADMERRNALFDAWRRVSRRHGFVEYDGPLFEYLELLTAKSGQEIVEQLFTLTDRGGRELALRPEMTPTLARMVNARAQTLPRPIKWFSIPRCFRAERPQRGRLREFFQWNIDVVGEGGTLADAETIFVAVDLLRELGLGPQDVAVKISSRDLMAGLFEQVGLPIDRHAMAYTLLDRGAKQSEAEARQRWDAEFAAVFPYTEMARLLESSSPRMLVERAGGTGARAAPLAEAAERVQAVFQLLHDFGISEYCNFDLRIVRGLAYYTGLVFEILDRGETLRALCGGGRYDTLLRSLGGPDLPAIGFGMGDVVLSHLLDETQHDWPQQGGVTAFLIDAEPEAFPTMIALTARLRELGVACACSYRRQGVGKQLREANTQGAAYAVIVGRETQERGVVSVKNLATGEQAEHAVTEVQARPHDVFAPARADEPR